MPNLGLGLNIQSGVSVSPYNSTYQAILTDASSRGVIQPSANEKTIQNALVKNLIDDGIWSKLDAFYMFANNITDATGGFALINWKNPSSNYGTSTALPSISAKSGFTGNGSTQFVNLNFNATTGTNFANPNGSFGVWVGTLAAAASPVIAAGIAGNRIRNGSSIIAGSSIATPSYTSNSFLHLNKTSGAMISFRNGISTAGTNATWVADNNSFNILKYNDSPSFGVSQVKVAFIGGDLASLAITFYNRISDYITALNAL
jgi:hypothetical protein